MTVLFFCVLALILVFGFVVLFGAPYLPTLNKQTEEALDLLSLQPGQVLLELGSGDGRFMRAAAKRGIRCVGYELNPILVLVSRAVTWRYRRLVTIKTANYWSVQWPKADGIYVFLLQKYMKKLDKKIIQEFGKTGKVSVVSFAFQIPDMKADTEKDGLFLYKYGNKR